jgi:flagellar motor component MotA
MPAKPLCAPDPAELVATFVRLSTIARSAGILALEKELFAVERADPFLGPFLSTALAMVVDGYEGAFIAETLRAYADAEIAAIRQILAMATVGTLALHAHMHPRGVAEQLGAYLAPTDKRRLAALLEREAHQHP